MSQRALVGTQDPDAKVEQPDAAVIFKGGGKFYGQEKHLYAAGVKVWFQKSAVVFYIPFYCPTYTLQG